MSKRLSRYRWNKRKIECFNRDEWRCKRCGSQYEIDAHHIIKRSKQGSDDLANLVTLCRNCHREHHKEFMTRWTPGLAKLREEAKREFEKLYPKQEDSNG